MADEIDDALLAVAGEHWSKVAMAPLRAEDKLGWDIDRDGRDEDFHRIAERL